MIQIEMPVRIAITDDHPMVRSGLVAMLDTVPGFVVSAQYASGNALLAGLQQHVPDILLLDMHLQDHHGNELMVLLNQRYPALPVIMVTATDSVYLVKSSLEAGAKGYVLKTTGGGQLEEAIRSVLHGEIFLSTEVKDLLLKNALKQKTSMSYHEQLTEKETAILQFIALEHTSQEIAAKLHLSTRTVENYRLGLMQKLDVKNLAGLVRKAILMGIVK